ncbi:class I fructose-bisphosphate aldolase [Bartonella acomydis]|uniref:class I fructose-bisphosphate aldolase n=1 Tax=Bartonella acomydis TaxID=686234 RepID=UPI003CD093C0
MQAAALKAWAGRHENIAVAQKAFHHRVRMNHLAALLTMDKRAGEVLYLRKGFYGHSFM